MPALSLDPVPELSSALLPLPPVNGGGVLSVPLDVAKVGAPTGGEYGLAGAVSFTVPSQQYSVRHVEQISGRGVLLRVNERSRAAQARHVGQEMLPLVTPPIVMASTPASRAICVSLSLYSSWNVE